MYAHVIIGLECETEAMWQQTVNELVALEIDGIKFHNLHVIRNIELAQEYAQHPFELMDEYTYAESLIELLHLIPSHIPIIRLATDTPDSELIAPLWHMSKAHFGEYIAQTMRYRGIQEAAAYFGKTTPLLEGDMPRKTLLSDGSVTFFGTNRIEIIIIQKAGAYRQARELFIEQSHLGERLTKRRCNAFRDWFLGCVHFVL